MSTEIIIEKERLDYMLDAFDMEIDDEGYVVDRDGNRVRSTDGDPIQKDKIGMAGHGSVEFVKDDISSLTNYLRR